MNLYTIFDKANDMLCPIFEAETDTKAARITADFYEKTPFKSDFLLFRIGKINKEFDCVEQFQNEGCIEDTKRILNISSLWKRYTQTDIEGEDK